MFIFHNTKTIHLGNFIKFIKKTCLASQTGFE
jgi:hypothetical protein